MKNSNNIGYKGETAVEKYLRRRFYRILERNYKCHWGEIDIIAQKGKHICFIEVKTRGENSIGRPAEFVTEDKQFKVIKSAYAYLKKNPSKLMARFDVAEVYVIGNKFKIDYIDNAFDVNDKNYYS